MARNKIKCDQFNLGGPVTTLAFICSPNRSGLQNLLFQRFFSRRWLKILLNRGNRTIENGQKATKRGSWMYEQRSMKKLREQICISKRRKNFKEKNERPPKNKDKGAVE
ncbi:hypothetical protein RUM43_003851 [Polyplax serrata]|uniref:Uncharacterized protein n=1 Tax=Polyplax serrata TaxID=468196 RepID=A0AAN8PZ00_POLSC